MPSSYAVGTHFERFIRLQIESGRYASASEVVRDALRLLEERQARLESLRAAIQAGADSGPGLPAEDVLTRLENKYGQAVS